MNPTRALLAALFTASTILIPTAACAATITIHAPASLARFDRDGVPISKRPMSLTPEGISGADCTEEQKIRVPIRLSDFQANATLSAWAALGGVDCKASSNRSGPNALCRPIASALPLAAAIDVDVPVREIVRAASPSGSTDADVCSGVDVSRVDLQFLYTNPGEATPSVTASVSIAVDTAANGPPQDVSATPSERGIAISWSPGVGTASSLTAATVHCAPSAGRCELPADGLEECARLEGPGGTTLAVAATGDGQPLRAGTEYVFAVATRDGFGNIGALSTPACAIPTEDGGCAVSRPGSVASSYAAASGLVVLGLAFALRARARSSRRRPDSHGTGERA